MNTQDFTLLKILKQRGFYVRLDGIEISLRDNKTDGIWLECDADEQDFDTLGELLKYMIDLQIEQDKDENLPHFLPRLLDLQEKIRQQPNEQKDQQP